jgi:hypothetical protein
MEMMMSTCTSRACMKNGVHFLLLLDNNRLRHQNSGSTKKLVNDQ